MVAIIPRSGWGAPRGIPGGRHVDLSQRRWVVFHWPGGNVSADEAQQVRNIDRAHQNQGWAVIGYNFLIGNSSGRIFEGAGQNIRGIHEASRNTDGFGICIMQGINQPLSQAAINSGRALYDHLCRVTGRSLNRSFHSAHFATQCPGNDIRGWVQRGMPATGGAPAPGPSQPAPGPNAFPGRIIMQPPIMRGDDVRHWQNRMRQLGFSLTADGAYGPQSEGVCRQFQGQRGLSVDGRVGPNTWAASFAGVTPGPPPAPQPTPPDQPREENEQRMAYLISIGAMWRTNGVQVNWIPTTDAAAALQFMGARFINVPDDSLRNGTWGTWLVGPCPGNLEERLRPHVHR